MYGIIFGSLIGCLYMSPMRIGVSYFPNKKGLICGLIFGCFGGGSFILSFLIIEIINPKNISPVYH